LTKSDQQSEKKPDNWYSQISQWSSNCYSFQDITVMGIDLGLCLFIISHLFICKPLLKMSSSYVT